MLYLDDKVTKYWVYTCLIYEIVIKNDVKNTTKYKIRMEYYLILKYFFRIKCAYRHAILIFAVIIIIIIISLM